MGLEMEFDKGIEMDQSPDSVLPAPRHFPDSEKRSIKQKPPRRDELLRVREGFTEISFRRCRSSSCKYFPSKPLGMGDRMEQRRGSVYQSSKDVLREVRNPGSIEERTKIELSRSSNASFSFRIVDYSNAEGKEKRLQDDSSAETCASDSFIDICLNSGIKDRAAVLDPNNEPNFRGNEAAGPLSECYDHSIRLPKSLSAKVERPRPTPSETNHCNRESSRVQFGHIRKMFDPFVKSKSLRSPLGYIGELDEFKIERKEDKAREKDQRKSLLSENSNIHQKLNSNALVMNKDHTLALKSSPVHLCGRLKIERKDGLPVFVFFLDSPEDVYIAKTWKSDKDFSWIYTFSSAGSRKKSNAILWGLNDCGRESSLVGQMQVSCSMCSKLRKDGQDPEDLMVTEFVLYDIAHARRNASVQESPSRRVSKNSAKLDLDLGCNELDDGSDMMKHRLQLKCTSESCDLGDSNESTPWPVTDLHPDLEIAAIVMQDPIEKRESLKYRRGDRRVTEKRNLLSFPPVEEVKKDLYAGKNQEKLKVVIPRGNHGIPTSEDLGPSPLLRRWRLGGGCDCGGWDMACPLIVFGNPNVQCSHGQPLLDNHQPLQLFVQGAKDSTPALSMSFVGEGQYEVHFHAQLSTLQAFSVCVAILHSTEFPGNCRNGESIQFSHCNSLKMLTEDEVNSLVEAVTEEKKKVPKPVKSNSLQSYMLNPPFSPISRV